MKKFKTICAQGDVLIRRLDVDGQPGPELAVPFDHLKRLVSDYVRNEMIRRLEERADDSLLGL